MITSKAQERGAELGTYTKLRDQHKQRHSEKTHNMAGTSSVQTRGRGRVLKE